MTRNGGITPFGTMADGTAVERITLQSGGLTASVLTLGAVLQDLRIAGVAHGLTLGSDRLADYEGAMRYHGPVIAPVVNRLTDAQAMIDGRICRFEPNQDGRHVLHSGSAGSHLAVWSILESRADAVLLGLAMPDGAGGFPGNRQVTARFTALPGLALRLEIRAETDQPTIFNAANHSYWNLDGSESYDGHRLRIAADAYLPCTDAFIPTGEIRPVEGTIFDFRNFAAVSPGNPSLDNCFCLSRERTALRDVLWLEGRSGLRMTVATTEPGMQIYDARAALRPGRGPGEGIAVEAQGWPDAPNKPAFPAITLTPGQPVTQITEWRFHPA